MMERMKRLQGALFAVFLLAGALLGHELAYTARYGVEGAQLLQRSGVHAYVAPLGEATSLGLVMALAVCLVFILLLRGAMRGARPASAHVTIWRWQLAFWIGQVAFYVLQETIEARLSGTTPASLGVLLLYGVPAHAIVAAVVGWLFTRLWIPLEYLAGAYDALLRSIPRAATPPRLSWITPLHLAISSGQAAGSSPRAPPPSARFAYLVCRERAAG
jgi:hypothetical protein